MPSDFEGLFAVASAFARRTGHFDVRHERQLSNDGAVAGTLLAPATLDVEAELRRTETPRFGPFTLSEELADRIVHADVSHRIGPRRTPDRRLINVHHVVHELGALERSVFAGKDAAVVTERREFLENDFMNERTF